jgi:sulfite exporter TauE/SafE
LALAFGLGTLPNLLAAGWLLRGLRRMRAWPVMRGAAGFLLLAVGIMGLVRADAISAQLSAALFCVVPQ